MEEETDIENINYINSTVWATLKKSSIHGIGVFAIRDIPKGTKLSDNNVTEPINLKHFTFNKKQLRLIRPEILNLILDRTIFPKGIEEVTIVSPNSNYTLTAFCNHSSESNCDSIYAIKDIKQDEEILTDFNSFYPLDELTLNHMGFLIKT